MQYWLVMPAAGVGRRFGEQRPKQYAPLRGRTVIEWALAPFLADARCAGIVIALASGDPYWPQIAARLAGVGASRIVIADGGAERSGSVRNGLAALGTTAKADDWVLVHDAARPCLLARDLSRLLESVELRPERSGGNPEKRQWRDAGPPGGLLATPAADTLKRAASPSTEVREVEQTVDRSGLWRALTPQMFRYARLCEALDEAAAAGRFPTDEAQAIEWLGGRPVLVEGSASNIKITSADDLVLAEALLGARAGFLAERADIGNGGGKG
jgi:2-C-methyl-D-erythritol 4-phosphate cytidylyltransferase